MFKTCDGFVSQEMPMMMTTTTEATFTCKMRFGYSFSKAHTGLLKASGDRDFWPIYGVSNMHLSMHKALYVYYF